MPNELNRFAPSGLNQHGDCARQPRLEGRATTSPTVIDEYKPGGPNETDLVDDLADTGWRLKRVPLLEAAILARAENPPDEKHGQNERRELKRACGILEMQKYKGLPWDPAQDGFVFLKDQLEGQEHQRRQSPATSHRSPATSHQ